MITDIESFTLDTKDIHRLGYKCAVVWGHKGASMQPVMYIRKPKHISQDDFDNMMKHIEIKFTNAQ